jgi:hypothetical protein
MGVGGVGLGVREGVREGGREGGMDEVCMHVGR